MTDDEAKAFAAAVNTPASYVVRRHRLVEERFETRRLRWLKEVRARLDRDIETSRADAGVEFKVITYEQIAESQRRHRERHRQAVDHELELRRVKLLTELAYLRELTRQVKAELRGLATHTTG